MRKLKERAKIPFFIALGLCFICIITMDVESATSKNFQYWWCSRTNSDFRGDYC